MWPHITAPWDYTAVPGLLVYFSPSDSSKTVSVIIVDDSDVEEMELFLVSIHVQEDTIDIPSNMTSIYIINNDGKEHMMLKGTCQKA